MFKSLTRLDMSECYFLVNMPKEISTFSELEALEGFVAVNLEEDSCNLGHLAGLPKLSKLSIFTRRNSFPSESELKDLNRFKKLHKLTIEWGRDSEGPSKNSNKAKNVSEENPSAQSAKQQNPGDVDNNNPVLGSNNTESNNSGYEAESVGM